MRNQIIEYVDGEEVSVEVCASPSGPSDRHRPPPLYQPCKLKTLNPPPTRKQEPPYKQIFLAFFLLIVGVVLSICGISVVTGYIDAKS